MFELKKKNRFVLDLRVINMDVAADIVFFSISYLLRVFTGHVYLTKRNGCSFLSTILMEHGTRECELYGYEIESEDVVNFLKEIFQELEHDKAHGSSLDLEILDPSSSSAIFIKLSIHLNGKQYSGELRLRSSPDSRPTIILSLSENLKPCFKDVSFFLTEEGVCNLKTLIEHLYGHESSARAI